MSSGNGGAAISFQNVSKSFGSFRVLDNVSFEIPRGQAIAVLGRSGTGKSVTLKLICGLLEQDSGSVKVLGKEVSELSAEQLTELRRNMGFMFQNSALFDSITLGENIAFPMRRHTRMSESEIQERVNELLAAVRLEGQNGKMPSDLSGGMKKRAALARAMALKPAILLVDEPSAGLDPITSGEIDDLMLSLRTGDGATLVVVTHNIPSARRIADRMMMLDQGRVRASGTLEDLEALDDDMVQHFLKSESGG